VSLAGAVDEAAQDAPMRPTTADQPGQVGAGAGPDGRGGDPTGRPRNRSGWFTPPRLRILALAVLTVVTIYAAASLNAQPADTGTGSPPPSTASPAGTGSGTVIPGHRLVALYGHPDDPGLGVLGQQDLPATITRAQQVAAQYAPLSDVPVLPAFEIIATIADQEAGADGDYSAETDPAALQSWVDQAADAGLYVILDLQPGRSDFLSQARRYTDLLARPNVGLALDPEWRLGPGQKHLEQIGGVDAGEVNQVLDWLADLTAAQGLPQKVVVLHQFQLSMLRDEARIGFTAHPELAVIVQMDGQGTPELKDQTWAAVTAAAPPATRFGWKDFLRNDTPTLTPEQTMTKTPTPDLISYE
jgi:hypothetical protein